MKSILLTIGVLIALTGAAFGHSDGPSIDAYTRHRLDQWFAEDASMFRAGDVSRRIAQISAQFLGTPYAAHTLVGSAVTPERLIVHFAGVDCFTLLDYVDALRKSKRASDFLAALKATRYVNADVDFRQRRHFFTDWAARHPRNAVDITGRLSSAAVSVPKMLNAKPDGTQYLAGLGVTPRRVAYIPARAVDASLLRQLRTGDYIGIYARASGLDVTHVGIFIRTGQGPMFRNASSLPGQNKVVDAPFMDYVKNKPGIIVLRPI